MAEKLDAGSAFPAMSIPLVGGSGGDVLTSSYSSGPIGRIDAADVIGMVKFIEARRAK